MVATASVIERVIDVFEGVFDFSRFLDKTVAPTTEPRTEVRRVVVLERDTPNLDFDCSVAGTFPVVGCGGEDIGDVFFVEVVKNPNTLSATILILALALLWDLVR